MSEHRDELSFTGKNCTCGIGPWSSEGVCDHCAGVDLGVAWLPFGLTGHPHDLPVPYLTNVDPDGYEDGAVFSRRMEERIRELAREEATKVIERLIDFAERQDRGHG